MSTSGYQINGIAAMPPTGSIIAYYGTSDPDGWVICNGVARPNTGIYTKLINMGIGSLNPPINDSYTPPNLQGYFLRGIGQVDSNHVGPTGIGDSQQDAISFKCSKSAVTYDGGGVDPWYLTINKTGGGTAYSTGTGLETRPINMGVNWIMKL